MSVLNLRVASIQTRRVSEGEQELPSLTRRVCTRHFTLDRAPEPPARLRVHQKRIVVGNPAIAGFAATQFEAKSERGGDIPKHRGEPRVVAQVLRRPDVAVERIVDAGADMKVHRNRMIYGERAQRKPTWAIPVSALLVSGN